MLFDEIKRAGGEPLMWRTGHSLIKAKMAETGAPLAGEMSGHIFFADRYYGYDDALYAAVRILNIVSRSDQSLAQMRRSLPRVMNTPELRFPCSEERKFVVVEETAERLRRAGADVNDIDGVRVRTADGWWLLRASNTQDDGGACMNPRRTAGLERLKAAVVAKLTASGSRRRAVLRRFAEGRGNWLPFSPRRLGHGSRLRSVKASLSRQSVEVGGLPLSQPSWSAKADHPRGFAGLRLASRQPRDFDR